jgi:hypothetical protein
MVESVESVELALALYMHLIDLHALDALAKQTSESQSFEDYLDSLEECGKWSFFVPVLAD